MVKDMPEAEAPSENLFVQQVSTTVGTPQSQTNDILPPMYDNLQASGGNTIHAARPPSAGSAPPTYEEAIDPDAPPPSYDSLFGRVRDAHNTSKGAFDFLKNVVILLLGTIGCTIVLGVTIVVPICMIVIACMYWNECPKCEYIPVYLLVGGAFGVLKQLIHLSTQVRPREHHVDEERVRRSPVHTLINCFMLGWFIVGSVWVYRLYEPNYDPTMGDYCNKTIYLFSFWLLTSVYIMLAVITVCMCSISVASIACQREV